MARKLTKKRKEERIYTMEIPKRFEDGPDADEDCTAPKGQSRMINQSVFGLIAAAGSQIDFNTRFEDIDDDEDDEPQMSTPQLNADTSEPKRNDEYNDQKRKPTHSRLFKSLSNLGGFTSSIKKHKPKLPTLSQSTTEPELSSSVKQEPRSQLGEEDMAEMDTASGLPHKGPPVMAQMLAARDEAAERGSFDLRRSYDQTAESSSSGEQGTHSSLAQRLKEIFDFDTTERVVDEFPCWLMKSVLLQGYLYVTSNHICFYAYLPKKTQTVVKSGYLTKRGYRNPTYNRYWFQLKGDVLSYYSNPADKYFPAGNIDLRYGISASVTPKERGGDPKGSTYFEVVTHSRSYQFQADSAPSAKEWVKALQKIIFRSHNEGDSVKISLPIENIIDVEDSQIVEFADTCKIRVVDNAESFAIDEVRFSPVLNVNSC